MLALLMAFYRPTSGRITIDGRDLADVRLRDWRKRLAVVLQDDTTTVVPPGFRVRVDRFANLRITEGE